MEPIIIQKLELVYSMKKWQNYQRHNPYGRKIRNIYLRNLTWVKTLVKKINIKLSVEFEEDQSKQIKKKIKAQQK